MLKKLIVKYYKTIGILLIVTGLLGLLTPFAVDYLLSRQKPIAYKSSSVIVSATTYRKVTKKKYPVLPANQEDKVIIPRIKVNTKIIESNNAKKALYKGVWRVYDFATPETSKPGFPVILAAHKFGYSNWSKEYRLKNSFYNLYKLVPGDTIQIIWNHKVYTYQVYNIERSTQINDYNADLILYTCETLNSKKRLFVYAREE